jgi:hypothetical protein
MITIRCITILKDTHPQIKFDVFERLNTGSVKLNAQELRHGLNHGEFMKMIDSLTKYEKWRKAVGIRSDKRMKSAELDNRKPITPFNSALYDAEMIGFTETQK